MALSLTLVALGVGNQVSHGSPTYETMNQQFRRLFEEDSKNQEATAAFAASVKVDAGVLSTGREGDDMWRSKKYKDPEFRKELTNSSTRVAQGYDPVASEMLRTSKFNIQKTPISEFSNASHSGTVFVNPKFSSC